MPRGQLSRAVRLQIAVTKWKKSAQHWKKLFEDAEEEGKRKDKKIRELEEKLEKKELERQKLLEQMYPKKHRIGTSKARGKKKGTRGYFRPIPKEEDVTQTFTFSLKRCPICQGPVGDAIETVTKYEEDIDMAPHLTIKQYLITRHWCGQCETFVKAKDIPKVSRIGPNVLGYILYARYHLRLPMDLIKESLFDLHSFSISEGEIAEKLQEAKELFQKDFEAITELIQSAKVVYADETGWRMEGENWWLWVFVTEGAIKYRLDMSRGKRVAENVLGTKTHRVIVSDAYPAYQNIPGDHQTCWVHLLRTAKNASKRLHTDLVKTYLSLGEELHKKGQERSPPKMKKMLQKILKTTYEEKGAKPLQERIQRDFKRLLTCLKYPDVLPENNTAERAIRSQVVMRKIFGGSRSLQGAKAHEVNSSVLKTLEKNHPDASLFHLLIPILQKKFQQKLNPSAP